MTTAIVIDDDSGIVEVFVDLLDACKIEVIGKYTDAEIGANMIIEKKPDMVFTDLMMPEKDGFYVIRRIKEAMIDTVIVPVTADSTNKSVEKLQRFEITHILNKPFSIKDLKKVIEDIQRIKMD